MIIARFALVSGAVLAVTISTPSAAGAQAAAPHTIVIKLMDESGPQPYGFEPAAITAHAGDTLRFVQGGATMHNVHFITVPKGAKLGSLATSEYLTAKGQAFTVVLDSRFSDGKYEIVCDPHQSVGMHAWLTVTGRSE